MTGGRVTMSEDAEAFSRLISSNFFKTIRDDEILQVKKQMALIFWPEIKYLSFVLLI